MSTSFSRATGRTVRLNSETSLEPSDEWKAQLRKNIEYELHPQLVQAEKERDEKLAEAGDDEDARGKIMEAYHDNKASYITMARIMFNEGVKEEKGRRRALVTGGADSQQRTTSEAAQRSRAARGPDSADLDNALPFADSGAIDQTAGPSDDPYPSPRTSQEPSRKYGQSPFPRRFGTADPENASNPSASLPRHIPTTRRESADTFDTDPEESEHGSVGIYGSVSRRQSSGSIKSLRARQAQLWPHVTQVSPKDVSVSRINEFTPSPSLSGPRRDASSSAGRSGISAAFTQSPPQAVPVRRNSNASVASSRSGGPGSVPRTSSMAPPFGRTAITPAAAAVPIYTPPPQGPFGHSPSKKEITNDYYAAIPSGPSSRSSLPPVSTASDSRQVDDLEDEPLLQHPSPDVDSTGKSWSTRLNLQRPLRRRTSSGDFNNRRIAVDARPGSSASRPSPIAVPSSPESYRAPPSSYSATHPRRSEDDQNGTGIPIPPSTSSDRNVAASQASPEWPRSYSARSVMRRKTSFNVDQYNNRNTSQSPESSRVPYSARRSSVSSHHSGKSGKSYSAYSEVYWRTFNSNANGQVNGNGNGSGGGNGNGNDEWSPMPAYAEQSHDGSASEHSDVDGEFDEQEFFEELMLREEEVDRREQELMQKVEEAQRKEEEVLRKEEEARKKEEEAKRKEEEILAKEEEARLKEIVAQRKEAEIKRKEDLALKKEEEVKKKEADARQKEEDARKKESDARKMEEDARRTEDEARKIEEQVRRLEEEARRKEAEVLKKEEEMRLKAEEAERKEEEAKRMEEEARRIEEEAKLREEEAARKEEEVRKREEALRLKEEEFERMEKEARQLSDEAKRRALELRLKEEVAVRREEEAKQMEEEARRREEDALRREEDARRKEDDARRKEDDARRREEYARVRAEEAKARADEVRQRAEDARVRAEEARVREDILRKREEEFKRKEDELRQREEELEKREAETKRLEEEKLEAAFLAEFARQRRMHLNELIQEQQDIANKLASQRKQRQQAEQLAARLQAEEAQEAALLAEQEELSRAEFLAQQEETRRAERLAQERRAAEARVAEEQHRAEVLAEERRRAEAHAQEERRRAEQAAQERWKAEAQAQEERQRAEIAEEERRRKEVARQLEEQRQEEIRRRAEQQRRQDAFGGSATRSGTPSTSASQAAFSNTSRQAPPSSANSDRSSTASNASWATNASWTSWASQGSSASSASTQSTAKAPPPPQRSASSSSHIPTGPSAARRATEDDYLKWQERQEEHARRQAEAFRKEQERMERQRQAKAGQMLTKEAVLQIVDDHDRMWARLSATDAASWSNFPWPMLKKPSNPEELTTTTISAYILNPYYPSEKSEKDRIKEHIRRWHPDRFETKLLPKVTSEDREKVKEGAGQVVRSLNELLTRSA